MEQFHTKSVCFNSIIYLAKFAKPAKKNYFIQLCLLSVLSVRVLDATFIIMTGVATIWYIPISDSCFCLHLFLVILHANNQEVMKFSIDKQEKYSVFTLENEKLNSQIAPLLKSEMILLNAEGIRNIIFDMSRIKFVDSSGLSSILISNRLCKSANGTFVLTGVNENVMKLIKISKLDEVFHIVPTLQEAKDLVMMEEIERDFNDDVKS